MSTIVEKINHINSTKGQIKNAIEEKGISVGDIPFSQYPSKIREIEQGTGTGGENGFSANAIYFENMTETSANIDISSILVYYNSGDRLDEKISIPAFYSQVVANINGVNICPYAPYRRSEGFSGDYIFTMNNLFDGNSRVGVITYKKDGVTSNQAGVILCFPTILEITGVKIKITPKYSTKSEDYTIKSSLAKVEFTSDNMNFLSEKILCDDVFNLTRNDTQVIEWNINGVTLP